MARETGHRLRRRACIFVRLLCRTCPRHDPHGPAVFSNGHALHDTGRHQRTGAHRAFPPWGIRLLQRSARRRAAPYQGPGVATKAEPLAGAAAAADNHQMQPDARQAAGARHMRRCTRVGRHCQLSGRIAHYFLAGAVCSTRGRRIAGPLHR
ncbi:hypothetical protein PCAR4_10116 [Paraburkholderia caribensis]|nr:hypothetical protein PCAR4_10116 [Paraburkholderia caribensis]